MKVASAALSLLLLWILFYGSPLAVPKPEAAHYYGSLSPILPMTFAHEDHITVGCIDCHHNYVDDTGGETCMTCHVTNLDVGPLLEEQFHALCRGCHEDLAAGGDAGGPPRQCIACHTVDDLP